jgi:hypothetical protein
MNMFIRAVTMVMDRGRHTDVPSQDILDLLLLETTLDDEPACTVYASCRAHFGEQELNNMFRL